MGATSQAFGIGATGKVAAGNGAAGNGAVGSGTAGNGGGDWEAHTENSVVGALERPRVALLDLPSPLRRKNDWPIIVSAFQ